MYLLGAAACTAGAFLTFVVLEIARHLQYLRYRDTGFVPGTQHWCMIACLIAVVFELAAVVFLILGVIRRGI